MYFPTRNYSVLILYQAYDGHLNMVLSDVEETVTIVEVEEDNVDPAVRVRLLVLMLKATTSWLLSCLVITEALLINRLSRNGQICCL